MKIIILILALLAFGVLQAQNIKIHSVDIRNVDVEGKLLTDPNERIKVKAARYIAGDVTFTSTEVGEKTYYVRITDRNKNMLGEGANYTHAIHLMTTPDKVGVPQIQSVEGWGNASGPGYWKRGKYTYTIVDENGNPLISNDFRVGHSTGHTVAIVGAVTICVALIIWAIIEDNGNDDDDSDFWWWNTSAVLQPAINVTYAASLGNELGDSWGEQGEYSTTIDNTDDTDYSDPVYDDDETINILEDEEVLLEDRLEKRELEYKMAKDKYEWTVKVKGEGSGAAEKAKKKLEKALKEYKKAKAACENNSNQ